MSGVPIKVWARALPDGVMRQLEQLASEPWAVEHVAAMPDAHVANGVAVGTVFATHGVVVPAALGGDLGCGVSALRFDFPAARLSSAELARLLEDLGRHIPVGDAVHRGKLSPLSPELSSPELSTAALEHTREWLGPKHLGTLGGGNHFVELDRDAGGDLWLLVHSGSRGLGSAVAAHHLRAAARHGLGTIRGLPLGTAEGAACKQDLEWALLFARANRELLVRRAAEVVSERCGAPPDWASQVDVHHNFVREEVHFGRPLLVHRKGAIAAPPGARAIIPGSMGTASYLVEGLGAAEAFQSASHGAGRRLTRREAREQIGSRQLEHSMRRVVFDRSRARALVEEAPEAYRDIREVLEDEAELVRPILRLEPIAVLKG